MTREEAIEILRKNRPTSDPRPCGMELCDAVDMAISALRQQETVTNRNGLNEQMTNAQKIRAMTDEELAHFLNQWGTSTRAWQKNEGETMYWLQMLEEEDDHA